MAKRKIGLTGTGKRTHGNVGTQFWKLRKKHGGNPKYDSAKLLLIACEDYFRYIDENPLTEEKLVSYKGFNELVEVTRPQPMTLIGLCVFIGISTDTWYNYKENKKLKKTCEDVQAVMFVQKFNGAAIDQFNARLIARELGIAEKKEHSGPNGKAIQMSNITEEELDRRIEELKNKNNG